MDMRVNYRGNASSAAGPACSAQRRYLDRRVVTEFKGIFVIQRIPQIREQRLFTGDLVEMADRADIGKDAFRVDILIDIQWTAVALLVSDIGIW